MATIGGSILEEKKHNNILPNFYLILFAHNI